MKSCAIFCRITSISLIGLWVYDFIHTPSGQPHLAIVVVSPLHSPWVKQAEFNQGCRKLSTSMVSKSAHLNSKGQICQQAAFHALLFRLLASIDKENKLLCMHVFTHQHPWYRKPRYSRSKNILHKKLNITNITCIKNTNSILNHHYTCWVYLKKCSIYIFIYIKYIYIRSIYEYHQKKIESKIPNFSRPMTVAFQRSTQDPKEPFRPARPACVRCAWRWWLSTYAWCVVRRHVSPSDWSPNEMRERDGRRWLV